MWVSTISVRNPEIGKDLPLGTCARKIVLCSQQAFEIHTDSPEVE
jgi:hypothetical protein